MESGWRGGGWKESGTTVIKGVCVITCTAAVTGLIAFYTCYFHYLCM